MDIDAGITVSRESLASRDTALACLAHLSAQSGQEPTIAGMHRGDLAGGNTLPVSRLVELAGDFALQTEHVRVDWPGLESIGFVNPLLVLLKNTNVVILTGAECDGAKLAIWDPLHRDGELLIVPRQEFERAWSGDVLKVTSCPSSAVSAIPDARPIAPGETHDERNQQFLHTPRRRLPLVRFCLIAVGIAAAIGGGAVLFRLTGGEDFRSHAASEGERSMPLTDAAPSTPTSPIEQAATREFPNASANSDSPMPHAPGSTIDTTALTRSDEPAASETSRSASLPTEPASSGDMSALRSSPGAPVAVASPAFGTTDVKPDTAGSAPAPIIPPADGSLSAEEIAVLLMRGDKSLSSGDVASARLYYGRAANAGDGQAALRLGETFDPFFIDRAHLRSARGDLAAAVFWYRRARDMGAVEADVLLNSLEAK
jgi:Peptidase C39 family